jgi:LDH2 family malate/lactate/ureidoglycolate dehydrogenase
MSEEVTLPLDEVRRISIDILTAGGLSDDHAHAIAGVVYAGQRDECHSHGMYRLLGCVRSVKEGKVNPNAVPDVVDNAPAVVRVDARFGFSPLAFERGKPRSSRKPAGRASPPWRSTTAITSPLSGQRWRRSARTDSWRSR